MTRDCPRCNAPCESWPADPACGVTYGGTGCTECAWGVSDRESDATYREAVESEEWR